MSTTAPGSYSGLITAGVTLTLQSSTITTGTTITNAGNYGYGPAVTGAYGTLFSLLNLGSVEGGSLGSGVSLSQGLVTNGIGGVIEGSIGVYLASGTLVDAGTITALGSNGVAVSFGSGAADALTLTKTGIINGGIAGLAGNDSIDLAGIAATSETFAAGTLTLFDNGYSVASLSLVGGFNTSEFTLSNDGQGGTEITLGTEILTGTYTGAFTVTAPNTTITANAEFNLTTGGINANSFQPATVVNEGTVITNGLFGSAIRVENGAITNALSGVIDVIGGGGFGVDVISGSIVNAGTISESVKTGTGAYLLGGELINQASGVILGPTGAGLNHGTIVNFGLISGSASDGTGIYLGINQQIPQITNAIGGVIQGSLGIDLSRGTLVNAGMIRSTAPTAGVAIQIGIFDDLIVVDPGSTIIGNVAGFIAGNTIDIAGETVTREKFANGALTLSNSHGALDTIAMSGQLNSSEFTLAADGIGGTNVTIGTELVTGHYNAGFTLSALTTTIEATARLSNTGGSYALYGGNLRTWSVLNDGIINGNTGNALLLQDGTVTNTASASITGKVGVQIGKGTLVNAGNITGTKSYGANVGTGGLTNAATGTISGLYGVFVGSTTVVNDGLIQDNVVGKGYGAVGQNATILNNADGTITGYIGAYLGAGTITNFGKIDGTSGIGIALGAHADTIVIEAGSTIIGAIAGFSASDTLDFAKTSLNGATFANGYLTLSEQGTVVATYGMVGQFTAGQFALSADGHGGTNVTLGAAIATGTYTGLTLSSAYTSIAQTAQIISTSAIAAVFGSTLSNWTVVNSGTVVDTTTGDGVKLAGAGTITNQASGYIAGYNGAYVSSGTVNNAGTMAGVFNGAEVIFGKVDNQAGGTLSGFFGAYVYNGTIINAGTIESTNGAAGTAAIVGQFQGTIIDDPGAVFIGQVVGGTETSGISLLELGSGAVEGTLTSYGTQFVDFRTLEVASGATWDIAGNTTITGSLVNDGTIIETAADTLTITGPISGSGSIIFDPTSITFNGPVSAGQVISLTGAGNTITLGDPTQFAGTISGLAAGDVLSLPSLTGLSGATYTNGTLELTGSFGTIDLAVTNSPDLTSGVSLTIGPNGPVLSVNCFASGTRIATARGEIQVEHLRINDLATLADGGFAPIIWLGRRTLQPARHPKPETINPVIIEPGAIADNIPTRSLTVSPDHAFWIDNLLIHAKTLINGSTIRQIAADTITYHHVELPTHAILLAEGAPAESYLFSTNRNQYENTSGAISLHPDFAQAMRDATGLAPITESGPAVEAIRARLLARATLNLTTDSDLHITTTAAGALITSRTFIPAELTPDPRDRRRLGVKIAALHIAGRAIPLNHPALSQGWHDCEPDGRWTTGAALIPHTILAGASPDQVVVTLACEASYRRAA